MNTPILALAYYKRYTFLMIVTIFLEVSSSSLGLLSPWPLKLIVDGVLGRSDPAIIHSVDFWMGSAPDSAKLILLCSLMAAINILSAIVAYYGSKISLKVGLNAVKDLRADAYEALQYLPLKFHDALNTSDTTYRVAYDSQAIQTLLSGVILPIFTSTLTLLGATFIMVSMSPVLALVSFAVIPPIFLCIRFYTKRIAGTSITRSASESSLLGLTQEVISSVKYVKIHCREEDELQRFSESAEFAKATAYDLSKLQIKSSLVVGFVMSLGTATLYLAGSLQVLKASMTLGSVLVFASYLAQLYRPIETLTNTSAVFAGATASLSRCFEILRLYGKHPNEAVTYGSPSLKVLNGSIAIRNLTFGYNKTSPVLKNLSLDIRPGEFVAIVGSSGHGKSTLLNILSGFYEPDCGSILIDNHDIKSFSKRSLRSSISLVLQETILLTGTIAENIAYGNPSATRDQIVYAARKAEALEFILNLPNGFDSYIGEGGARLSGGQRQRISIARAFLRDTPLLMLDEPTSSLDVITERNIIPAIVDLASRRTTIMVTHRLALSDCADKILVMSNGTVVESGNPRDLAIASSVYSSMRKSAGLAAIDSLA